MKHPDVQALYDEDSSQPAPPARAVLSTDTPSVSSDSPEPSQHSRTYLRPGVLLGANYEIIEELGAGGMGRVYLATDRSLKRKVALKLMRERALEHESAETFRKRFTAEAVLPAQLSHPNIIAVFDRGAREGIEYFVMEYIAGARTLKTVLDEARAAKQYLPLELVASYAQQAAQGLLALHSCEGVWHRDVKLDNLLVYDLPGGTPGLKLIDFGIAHQPDQDLTEYGDLPGTPAYMAPEFFEMSDDGITPVALDHRSDLFALGIVLYRLLTLTHPFPGIRGVRDAMAAYRSPTELPCLPSLLRRGLLPGWDNVVMTLLERDRQARYQTARAFLDDLRRVDSLGPYAGDGARRELPVSPPRPVDVHAKTNQGQGSPVPSDPPTLPSDAYVVVASPAEDAARDPLPASQPSLPSATPGPGQWAAAWQPAQDGHRQKLLGKATLAILATVLVLVLGGLLVFATGQLTPASVGDTIGKWQMPGEKRPDPDQWVEDTKDAKLFASPAMSPATTTPALAPVSPAADSSSTAAAAATAPPSPSPAATLKRGGGRGHKPRRAAKSGTPRHNAAPAEPDNPWVALYGSGARDLNTGTLSVRTDGGATPTTAADAKGQRLPAKLLDNVASAPTGAPVVAQLTKATVLGPHRLPAGSEIHGQTKSSQGDRVFVEFHFVRLHTGTVIQLQAIARGRDGRPGIQGSKQLGSRAAGDVAATGASSTIRQAAGEAAAALGDVVGSDAIREMGASSAERARSTVDDSDVVIAARNTPFVVYVEALKPLP